MLCVPLVHPHAATFLPSFPKPGFALRAFHAPRRLRDTLRYYEGSDSCRPRPRPAGLSAYSALPSEHPIPKHVMRLNVAFAVTSARSIGARRAPRLRHVIAGSPLHTAESGSSSYRLLFRLRLLSTPPHDDAVTFGYM